MILTIIAKVVICSDSTLMPIKIITNMAVQKYLFLIFLCVEIVVY